MFYALRFALLALLLRVLASSDASWAGDVGADAPRQAPTPSTPSGSWDDSHMQSRYPRLTGSSSSVPRLILPKGRSQGSLPEGRTIYATPDRSWESGPDVRTRPRTTRHRSTVLTAPATSRTSMARSSGVRSSGSVQRRSTR